jgi:hypothetical protein
MVLGWTRSVLRGPYGLYARMIGNCGKSGWIVRNLVERARVPPAEPGGLGGANSGDFLDRG